MSAKASTARPHGKHGGKPKPSRAHNAAADSVSHTVHLESSSHHPQSAPATLAHTAVSPAAAASGGRSSWFAFGVLFLIIVTVLIYFNTLFNKKKRRLHAANRINASMIAHAANEVAARAKGEALVRVAPTGLAASKDKNRGDPRVVAAAANRGLGLFAIQPLVLGQCMLVEPPLFTAPEDPSQLAAAWEKLEPERRKAVLDFSDGMAGPLDKHKLSGIVRTNALPCVSGSDEQQSKGTTDGENAATKAQAVSSGATATSQYDYRRTLKSSSPNSGNIFLLASRANHSCLPNAEYHWDPQRRREMLYPCPEPLKAWTLPGEVPTVKDRSEITVSYIDSPRLDFSQRRQALQDLFGFVCHCTLCVGQGALSLSSGATRNEARIASDANRRRIASLTTLLPSCARDPERMIDVSSRLVSLLAEEGFTHSSHTAQVRLDAARLLEAHSSSSGHARRAMDFARAAHKGFVQQQGEDSHSAHEALALQKRLEAACAEEEAEEAGIVRVEHDTADAASAADTAADTTAEAPTENDAALRRRHDGARAADS